MIVRATSQEAEGYPSWSLQQSLPLKVALAERYAPLLSPSL